MTARRPAKKATPRKRTPRALTSVPPTVDETETITTEPQVEQLMMPVLTEAPYMMVPKQDQIALLSDRIRNLEIEHYKFTVLGFEEEGGNDANALASHTAARIEIERKLQLLRVSYASLLQS
jgi:hypothetical protein